MVAHFRSLNPAHSGTSDHRIGNLHAGHALQLTEPCACSAARVGNVRAVLQHSLSMVLTARLATMASVMCRKRLALQCAAIARVFILFVVMQETIQSVRNSACCTQCTLAREFNKFISSRNSYSPCSYCQDYCTRSQLFLAMKRKVQEWSSVTV